MIQVFKAALFLFTVVVGAIVFYLPLTLVLLGFAADAPDLRLRSLGLLCWVGGGLIALGCTIAFGAYGHGTPAPTAPTTALVERGLYRYSRNPMYVGVLVLVLGYVRWFQSWVLLGYWGAVLLLFHTVIVVYEEPRLRRQFGATYAAYCQRVPRWLIWCGV